MKFSIEIQFIKTVWLFVQYYFSNIYNILQR